MIYYSDSLVTIRNMEPEDAPVIVDEEKAQGWEADIAKYKMRLDDQQQGKSIALVALYDGALAGYINVYKEALGGPFMGTGYPEIVDFGVLEKYRSRGIGSKLMNVAERIAGQYADTVCIGVGLHIGYGSAQRLYARRGYIPDGTGVWYKDRPSIPYKSVFTNDDDLVLYMSKELDEPEKQITENLGDESVQIRVMRIEDYDSVYALWLSCRNMGLNNLDDSREGIGRYLWRNPTTCFIAIQRKKVVGVILSGHDGRRGFIYHMAVAEECRHQGIGTSLLNHALYALRREGINKVALVVFKRNETGNAFWEGRKFTLRDDLNYRNLALTELIRMDT